MANFYLVTDVNESDTLTVRHSPAEKNQIEPPYVDDPVYYEEELFAYISAVSEIVDGWIIILTTKVIADIGIGSLLVIGKS